ncbi:MAG: ImmA/IrrE family metallo-endopeptidase [bacterium]|nr:ImmA/IrrE family metallo-endopeptidase [bacterium]
MTITTNLIGARIKAAREESRLSQDALAGRFGFKDRQTLSAIETGERRVSAEELVRAVTIFDKPLEFFTDPFRLVGEGRFNWRHTEVGLPRLNSYERSAGRWIAAFREIAPQVGRDAPLMRRTLNLTRRSSFEDAMAAGERFAVDFDLGRVPGLRLAETMERDLSILVLMVDAFEGISGAACRLPALDVVLINRHEAPGRRHFDLAHELFHILTWEEMPPAHEEAATVTGGNRVEQLANNFASALLMPQVSLDSYRIDWAALDDNDLIDRINAIAIDLQVTAPALKWRLVALGLLKPARARAIPDAMLRQRATEGETEPPPPLFSRPFMEVIGMAAREGRVSVRRAAGLLDLTVDDLEDLFATHGVEAPVEL